VSVKSDAPLDTTVAIEAPEQICFHHRLAGPAQRGMAHLIDLALIALLLVLFAVLVVLALGPQMEGAPPVEGGRDVGEGVAKAGAGIGLVLLFVLQWWYFVLFEARWRGQTPGKRLLSLRVVKSGGEPIGFVDALLRNLLRSADLLPFGYAVGLVAMLLDGRFRRLGDLAAGTIVIVEDRVRVDTRLAIAPPTPQEQSMLPARVVLVGDELRTLELFLRRKPLLGAELSAELAAPVAQSLGRKHGAWHPDPVRLLELLYLRATAPLPARTSMAAGAFAPSEARVQS
jgi:uncharacterized RDD family membrane protein YckC